MKILIDENLPVKLKTKLNVFEVFTVNDMKWNSMKNGNLLKAAIDNNFTIFITSDKNLQYQQNLKSLNITIIVIDTLSLKWNNIEPLVGKIINAISLSSENKVYIVK